jgi:hypothetical protein
MRVDDVPAGRSSNRARRSPSGAIAAAEAVGELVGSDATLDAVVAQQVRRPLAIGV